MTTTTTHTATHAEWINLNEFPAGNFPAAAAVSPAYSGTERCSIEYQHRKPRILELALSTLQNFISVTTLMSQNLINLDRGLSRLTSQQYVEALLFFRKYPFSKLVDDLEAVLPDLEEQTATVAKEKENYLNALDASYKKKAPRKIALDAGFNRNAPRGVAPDHALNKWTSAENKLEMMKKSAPADPKETANVARLTVTVYSRELQAGGSCN